MSVFKLALKFFIRELRHGEFHLLLLSLLIATGSLTSVSFLIQHINYSMNSHASQLNGAQLILKSSTAVPKSWLKKAQEDNLEFAQMQKFTSMLVFGDEFKLAQVKAVSDNFPLQGELRIIRKNELIVSKAPPGGEIWLDSRLNEQFNEYTTNTRSSVIELGESKFHVGAILQRVPGQSSSFFSIAPSAMINLTDLALTDTVQPGSKVDYLYFFSSSSADPLSSDSLKRYQKWLQDKLLPGQTLRSGVEDIKAVNASLQKAGRFLSLAAMLTLLLSAVAIAINSYQYGQKQFKNNAILLCLGCSEKNILHLELFKLFLVGLAGSLMGIIIGYFVFIGLLNLIESVLPLGTFSETTGGELHFYTLPIWTGLVSGLFLLLSLSMANLSQIRKISPMGLIRKDFLQQNFNRKWFYLMSFSGLIIISFWMTGNVQITLWFYLVLLSSVMILYFVARFVLYLVIKSGRHFQMINRLSLLNLERHKQAVLLQITTFSLIFSLLIIIFLIRTELLENWQAQFPKETPNHFVINIQSVEKQQFEDFMQQNSIKTQGLYPMVRGRLSYLNQKPIMQAVPEEARDHNALHRELNLSFDITKHNEAHVKGSQAEISIERSMAEVLNIQQGDLLGFQIGARKIEGIVTDIRVVAWDSFQPNFYIIFSPGLIEQYPMNWIASFYLNTDDQFKLNKLMQQFPGITIIEVDEILREVQLIINRVSNAIELIFVFIVVAGVLILSSSLLVTLASRMYENAVLRTLGASARQLRHYLFIEFTVVALITTLVAVVLAESASYVLYQQVFQMDYNLHPQVWLSMSIIALLLICGLGLLMVNKIFTQPANLLLNQWTE